MMTDFEKLSLLLPADMVKSVREALDGARYVVESDVVMDALSDWKMKQQARAAKIEHLRTLMQEGIASGFEEMPADEFERIKREGRERLAADKAAE